MKETESSTNIEIFTCEVELVYIKYCAEDLSACGKILEDLHKKLDLTCNKSLLYIHNTCLGATLASTNGELDKSLRLTYDCLADAQSIFPGWENAVLWKTHGATLAEVATTEAGEFLITKRVKSC